MLWAPFGPCPIPTHKADLSPFFKKKTKHSLPLPQALMGCKSGSKTTPPPTLQSATGRIKTNAALSEAPPTITPCPAKRTAGWRNKVWSVGRCQGFTGQRDGCCHLSPLASLKGSLGSRAEQGGQTTLEWTWVKQETCLSKGGTLLSSTLVDLSLSLP